MESQSNFVEIFLSGLGGAFIAVGFEFIWSIVKEKRELQAVCNAFATELSVLMKLHLESVGVLDINVPEANARILDDKYLGRYVAEQDYFTVFESNAGEIGKIKDDKLRDDLITVYLKSKSLVDSFRINNEFLDKYIEYILEKKDLENGATYDNVLKHHLKHLANQQSDLLRITPILVADLKAYAEQPILKLLLPYKL